MAQLRHITLDGETVTAGDPLWIGPERRLGLGVFTASGEIVGHWVERIGPDSYRSLGVGDPDQMQRVLELMAQAI